jgi:hypothetical protein
MVNKNIIMQIYKITNLINHKIYIGKDTTSDTNYFGSGLLIKRALNKYGVENFIKEVIEETDDYIELSNKEIYWIEQYNSTDREIGYNISKGGDGDDTLSNHPDLNLIKEKISKNSPKKGKTYEEVFGEEKSKEYKEKLKINIYKNILSTDSILKNKQKWKEYNDEFKERCVFIKNEINQGKIDEYLDELKNIKKKVYNNFLKNANGFYDFFGEDLRYIIGNLKIIENKEFEKINKLIIEKDIDGLISYIDCIPNRFFNKRYKFYEYIGEDLKSKIKIKLQEKRRKTNSFNDSNKREIIIDNIQYGSISQASKNLNLDRSLIRSRLKSSHFKNYLFKDNDLNIKYNKYIDVDTHLSKKERVSIDGVEYGSITDAVKNLNKPHDYINWRLNSKSYPNWFYLDKVVELKETGIPKLKPVSINGVEYESISKAVEGSGIDRQIMRYRLKSNNHTEYFYIK